MRYLSVCSGIEAASVAWEPLGLKPVAFSEIKPFPCSVLSHRFPNVPNMGDMTAYKEWPIEPGSVDILVGGTPCQSFSIAGLRGGLDDARGNLALTYCRILDRFKPRWFVWENVPGVLSSNGGRDFGSILGAMEELGYGIAYRVLDAQYFGVPQRRRRVFVVGCLGNWRRAAEVFFEPGCVRGNSKTGGKKKSKVAALTATGVGTCGADDNQGQAGHLITSITSHYGKGVDSDCTAPLVTYSLRGEGFDASEDGTGRGTPLVPVAYQCHGTNVGEMGTIRKGNGNTSGGVPFLETPFAQNQLGEVRCGEVFNTINTNSNASGRNTPMVHIATSTGHTSHCLNAGAMGTQDFETETMVVAIQERAVSANETNGPGGVGFRAYGKAYTLEARNHVQAVAFAQNSRNEIRLEGGDGFRTGCMTGGGGKPGQGLPTVAGSIGVRRLTPIECERLQGFPDDWTLVPHGLKGKPATDGPRYKAIGNSMAVPVMRWIGERIRIQDSGVGIQ